MTGSLIGMEYGQRPGSGPLTAVDVDRRGGLQWHPVFGWVELVDHVTAWVFEGGKVLAVVRRRSVLCLGQLLESRELCPASRVTLSAIERHDVLHATGVQGDESGASTRGEVA